MKKLICFLFEHKFKHKGLGRWVCIRCGEDLDKAKFLGLWFEIKWMFGKIHDWYLVKTGKLPF